MLGHRGLFGVAAATRGGGVVFGAGLLGTLAPATAVSGAAGNGAQIPDQISTTKPGRASRALEVYIRLAREHESMMGRERVEFDRGKRHLANMMSVEAHALTQEDIDRAIAYLFPSGLSDKKALPVLRPPDEILPRFNVLRFDNEGRPEGSRFYTLKPNFYTLLSEIGARTEKVHKFHDERVGRTEGEKELHAFSTGGSVWLTEDLMAKKLREKISSELYENLIMALNNLASLPGSETQADFLNNYRTPIASGSGLKLFGPEIPAVEIDSTNNRRFAVAKASVKRTTAEVRVTDAGTGKYTVDGEELDTFQALQAREILLCPLLATNTLGKCDITAKTEGTGGTSAAPRAVRHALALCIAALRPDQAERLRIAGLLTSDPRRRERSKVNQPGARAKWIWKRR